MTYRDLRVGSTVTLHGKPCKVTAIGDDACQRGNVQIAWRSEGDWGVVSVKADGEVQR
jgi:hypothetical protein